MDTLEIALVLLFAVLLSLAGKQIFKWLSIPGIQIILGVIIALLWSNSAELTLDPKLFFCLYIAPLLFIEAKNSDKRELVHLRREILLFAFGLVLLTVLIIGFCTHLLEPSLPMAVCFVLAAALAPTDAVAVANLKQKFRSRQKALHILEGEALINDASGIVSFQFALAAVATGTFSLQKAGFELIGVALGGLAIGALLHLVKFFLITSVRKIGVETTSFFVLSEIITPFLVYLAAEELGVSGILAVVTSGVLHSINRKRVDPSSARIRTATATTWEMLSFVLNGFVFLMLGLQVPHIVNDAYFSANGFLWLLFISLIIVFLLYFVRFLWSLFFVSTEEKGTKHRLKNSLILALGGAKGAVSLGTILSIPVFFVDGTTFPARSSILFIVAVVIIYTMLVSNFILPLCLSGGKSEQKYEARRRVSIEIAVINEVTKELSANLEDDDTGIIQQVIMEYNNRREALEKKLRADIFTSSSLQLKVLKWRKEAALKLCDEGKAPPQFVGQFLRHINSEIMEFTTNYREKRVLLQEIKAFNKVHKDDFRSRKSGGSKRLLQIFRMIKGQRSEKIQDMRSVIIQITGEIDKYVLKRLKYLQTVCEIPEDAPIEARIVNQQTTQSREEKLNEEELQMLIDEYTIKCRVFSGQRGNFQQQNREKQIAKYTKTITRAFAVEREAIRTQFDEGIIDRETYDDYIKDINLMELAN